MRMEKTCPPSTKRESSTPTGCHGRSHRRPPRTTSRRAGDAPLRLRHQPHDPSRWIRLRDTGAEVTLAVKEIAHDGINGARLEIDTWPRIPPYLEIEADTRQRVIDTAALLGYHEAQLTGENTIKIYARYGIDLNTTPEFPVHPQCFADTRTEVSHMIRQVVTSAEMPRALGPYSPVVRAGDLLFLSAQTGVDPATGSVPEQGGFEAECRQAFANLRQALQASGSDLHHVVKTMVLYADLGDLPVLNKVYAETFPTDPPARTAAVVTLAGGRRICVDAIAVVDERQ